MINHARLLQGLKKLASHRDPDKKRVLPLRLHYMTSFKQPPARTDDGRGFPPDYLGSDRLRQRCSFVDSETCQRLSLLANQCRLKVREMMCAGRPQAPFSPFFIFFSLCFPTLPSAMLGQRVKQHCGSEVVVVELLPPPPRASIRSAAEPLQSFVSTPPLLFFSRFLFLPIPLTLIYYPARKHT